MIHSCNMTAPYQKPLFSPSTPSEGHEQKLLRRLVLEFRVNGFSAENFLNSFSIGTGGLQGIVTCQEVLFVSLRLVEIFLISVGV